MFVRRPPGMSSLVPSPSIFGTPTTDEHRAIAWERTGNAVKRAVEICNFHGVPLTAIGSILQLYSAALDGAAIEQQNERARAQVQLIAQIEQLRAEREPKKPKYGADCGDLNHDLLNMDDAQLAAELARLEALPKVVP